MRVATCLSGEARLLEEPCATRAIFDRVVIPLKSEVFIALNVANAHGIEPSRQAMQSILMSYKPTPIVQLFDVEVFNNAVSAFTTQTCTDHDRVSEKQAVGLVRCATSIFAQRTSYDWVVRLRSDLYFPYIIQSLPLARDASGHILVDYVGGQCMKGVAWWTDDRMALLPLESTQKAYLLGYANDFCRRPTEDHRWRPGECKLGWTLASRGVTPVGLGGSWNRRIRILRPVANVCTTLGTHNRYPTIPWPNVSGVLSANNILEVIRINNLRP